VISHPFISRSVDNRDFNRTICHWGNLDSRQSWAIIDLFGGDNARRRMKAWCTRRGIGESACFGSVLENARIRYNDEDTEKLFAVESEINLSLSSFLFEMAIITRIHDP